MDHGPSRRGHFGARGGSPPRGGMCGPTAPTALRRRSFRSSDRGRDFVFGSSLGRPGEHDDCLALSRRSSLLEIAGATSPQGPTSGWRLRLAHHHRPSGRRRWVRRSMRPLRRAGAREWRADAHASGCARPRRAVSPSCTRATAEGRREGARTTGRRSSERALGRERVSSEMRRDDVGNRMPSGVRTDAVDLLSGQIHWHPLRGPSGMRPRRLLRETPEPPRLTAVVPSGTTGRRSQGARQGRNTLPSLHVRVRGRRSGSGRQAERPARAGRREKRGSVGTSRSKAQGSIERSRDGNVARTQRTPRWKKALRSRAAQRSVATRERARLQRREGTPAGERDRVRKDEAR